MQNGAIDRVLKKIPYLSERKFGFPEIGNRLDKKAFSPYVQEVKDALIDSKAKIQDFIDNMEKEGTSDNDKVNKLNKEMIDDGKKLIEDIDKRLKKLDDISDKDLEKSDAEFRRLVGDHIVLEKEGDHEFRKILRKLDKELNIERKSPEK